MVEVRIVALGPVPTQVATSRFIEHRHLETLWGESEACVLQYTSPYLHNLIQDGAVARCLIAFLSCPRSVYILAI